MPSLTIQLSDQELAAIKAEIDQGRHPSATELVRDALADYLTPNPAPTPADMLAEIEAMHREIDNGQHLLDPQTVRRQITQSLDR